MRLLLGSGGFRTPERIAFLQDRLRALFGDIKEVVFVPYALADHDGYVRTMQERGLDAGYRLVGLHTFPDPAEAVRCAEGLFVGGGNTFRLQAAIYKAGLVAPILNRVRAGTPFVGVSAGCNLACPTIKTTNDMPIVQPPTLQALGLVPFQINPHYFTGQTHLKDQDGYREHLGETRDDRIREFHEMNETPVVGLWEGAVLWCVGDIVELQGGPARLFRRGEAPVDLESGARLEAFFRREPSVVYTVGVTFREAPLAEEWLAWMGGGHIADVMAGGAASAELVELDVEQGRAFEVRYRFASRSAFQTYEQDHAPRLRAEGLARFPPEKGVTYRRSVGVARGVVQKQVTLGTKRPGSRRSNLAKKDQRGTGS